MPPKRNHEECSQGRKKHKKRILISPEFNSCEKLFFARIPLENLVSRAPGIPILTQQINTKSDLKTTRKKQIALGAQEPFKMGSKIVPESIKLRLQTPTCPSCCSHCLPGCSRNPKMGPQGAKIEAPGGKASQITVSGTKNDYHALLRT